MKTDPPIPPRNHTPPAAFGRLISILIPVYNEAGTIAETVRRIHAAEYPLPYEIVMVDDGSTDESWSVLQSLAGENVTVLRHESNLGKGMALRTALEKARGDVVIVQDADLEYFPEDIANVVSPIINNTADVVYGSRFLGDCRAMKPLYRLGNWGMAVAASILFLRRVTDEATCYKAFRTGVLKSFELKCRGFEFCPEVTAKTLRSRLRFVEVPIRYEARGASEGKKLSWRHGLQALWTLVRYRFAR